MNRQKKKPIFAHPGGMTLQDYLSGLGHLSVHQMCRECGIPETLHHTFRRSQPIARPYAEKIAAWLSKEYQRDIRVSDIADLEIIDPGRKLPDPAPDPEQ